MWDPNFGSHANQIGSLERYIQPSYGSTQSSSEEDELVEETQELISMFDTQVPLTMPAMPATPSNKKGQRGKVRTVPYSSTEKPAKNKGHSRALKTIKKRLNYLNNVHPDTQFFFYCRTSSRQNILIVSKGLEGIDTSRSLGIIHSTLEDYENNGRPVPSVSYEERFDVDSLPTNPSFEDAFARFEQTQTAKSVKPIYTMMQRAGLISEPRSRIANLQWYMVRFKGLFNRESRISASMLWSACSSLQYHGSTGVGFKYKEVKRRHFIGLMQSLDLLAKARGEPPLPSDVDFAGNRLLRRSDDLSNNTAPNPSNSDVGSPVIGNASIGTPLSVQPLVL